jgi:RNA polymerase sigma-70 factor (ECF subfamily)
MAQAFSDDSDLIRQLARGNEAAFSTIYARYQAPVYRFAWHMSGDAALAEDVTQEVFVHLIERPKQYDPAKGPVLNYLVGIGRNLVRRRLQQTRNSVPIEDDLVDGDPAELDFAAELDRRSLLNTLRTAVLALPEQYREAVVLCDIEEMSYPEAGLIMNCPPGTVASRLHRARSMLKARLQGMGCAR